MYIKKDLFFKSETQYENILSHTNNIMSQMYNDYTYT